MSDSSPTLRARATYIGGPTVLLEVGGFRLLTDPTLDPGGTEYTTAIYTLRKAEGPAVPMAERRRSMPCSSLTTTTSIISIAPAASSSSGRR